MSVSYSILAVNRLPFGGFCGLLKKGNFQLLLWNDCRVKMLGRRVGKAQGGKGARWKRVEKTQGGKDAGWNVGGEACLQAAMEDGAKDWE